MMLKNRDRLLWLMHETGWKYRDIAQNLEKQTGRPCSERTVRAWLDVPESRHARTCQDWVINQLCAWLELHGQVDVVHRMPRTSSRVGLQDAI